MNTTTLSKYRSSLLVALTVCLLAVSQHEVQAQKAILLEHVNIIDGTGGPVQQDKHVLIREGLIQGIFDEKEQIEADNIERIDLSGKYLLPGLFDSHVHFATNPSGSDKLELARARLSRYLQHGITGVRDMAGDVRQLAYLSRQASLDEIQSPDIYFSSLMAGASFFDDPRTVASAKGYGPGEAPWMKAVTDETDVALAIAAAKGTGATGIKIYADLPAHLSKKVIEEAKRQDFLIWSHASVIPTMPGELVAAGINGLSHASLLAWEVADNKSESGKQRYNNTDLNTRDPRFLSLLREMAKKQIYLDPTVKIYKGRDNAYNNGLKATQAAYKAGVPLVIGTDMSMNSQNVAHFPLIDEMETLVNEVGIPPLEVIKAATLNTARFLRIADTVGSVEEGKKANLLIVDANPLTNITHLMQVHAVYKNGKRVD
ncbi:MAG: amidohydrolase family protein [Roseivirga sp.]|nr:amidohydrolase family protein [Roseivirga sp.]